MCPKDLHTLRGAYYLIVLHDCVVLQDIAGTIEEFDPSAQVIAVTNPAEAAARLAEVEQIAIAFVEAAPLAFGSTSLALEIASRGGHVVYLGDAAEDAEDTGRWVILRRPFSSDVVANHLAGLMPK